MEVLASIPNLDKRVKNFLAGLLEEPCTGPPFISDDEPLKIGSCVFLSNSNRMCVACRQRLYFFHTVFNGGAYDPSLDE